MCIKIMFVIALIANYTNTNTCVCVCVCVCVSGCINVCLCVYMIVCVHTHTIMYTHDTNTTQKSAEMEEWRGKLVGETREELEGMKGSLQELRRKVRRLQSRQDQRLESDLQELQLHLQQETSHVRVCVCV